MIRKGGYKQKNKKSAFVFGFVFDLNKNLTLKKDNLFSFSLLNRFFALSLQRINKERTNMNTSISIDSSLFNFAVKCAKVEKIDVNQLIESILWDGLDQLQLPLSDTDNESSDMEALPKSVLISAAEYALSESNKDRGISNDDVESVISKRRGWR